MEIFSSVALCIPNFTIGDIIEDWPLPKCRSDLNLVAAVDLDEREMTENSRWIRGELENFEIDPFEETEANVGISC